MIRRTSTGEFIGGTILTLCVIGILWFTITLTFAIPRMPYASPVVAISSSKLVYTDANGLLVIREGVIKYDAPHQGSRPVFTFTDGATLILGANVNYELIPSQLSN